MDVKGITQMKVYEEIVPQQIRGTNNLNSEFDNNNEELLQKIKANQGYVPSISEKAIINAIEEANKKIAGPNMTFEISIHERSKEIIIKIFNSDTKELIREIPTEKILDMVASMCEAAGLFVDEKR
ncbi:MAG: flagellar protein FlaG [Cellulosilyticaceae bacterium]